MAAAGIRFIDVPAGQEQVPVTDWDRVRVLGLGMPAWDRLRENHGIEQTESPTIAVTMKLTAEGIAGSSFIAAGVGNVDIALKRICPEASSRARMSFKCDLMEYEWPRDTDHRNISLWRDIKSLPDTKVSHTRSNRADDDREERDIQLYEGLSGLLTRVVLLLGADCTVYVAVQVGEINWFE